MAFVRPWCRFIRTGIEVSLGVSEPHGANYKDRYTLGASPGTKTADALTQTSQGSHFARLSNVAIHTRGSSKKES